ncbi:sensor histidine kinase [Hyalangium sp.]|uniref:sensor histidine kinase n=1 Tax=Hyalangium sp. TaxID=2028555 RepID=UPI002D567DEF|nr:two-component regulator propeller domain-containing protein [Hyalangium sp.]HYI02056.1 two-component regulator propeller domain-containing protein [Hyalangium sp.]
MCRVLGSCRAQRGPPAAFLRARAPLLAAAVLVALLGAARTASALEPNKGLNQFPHRVWQPEDGLPQNTTLALAQTPDGYLWAGTYEGLVRFDGERFTVFDPMKTPALLDRSITSLAVDKSGTLWINTNRGLAGLRAGTFFPVPLPAGVVAREVHQLLTTRDGSLWIATHGSGLIRMYATHSQVFKTEQGLASNRVLALTEAEDGSLWVATAQGLQRWDGRTFLPGPLFKEEPPPLVAALEVDAKGTLWAGDEGGYVYQLQGGLMHPVPDASLPGAPISVLLADRQGSFWVASKGRGLLRMANGQRSFMGPTEGLERGSIFSMLEDADGSLWLGMGAHGLHRLKDAPFTPYGPPEGLGHNMVSSVREARDGSLWFGTLGGGISRWKDGRVTTWTMRDGIIDNFVFGSAEGRDGSLWFVTRGGVVRFRDGTFTNVPEHGLASRQSMGYAIYEDEHGTVWTGTREGLARWDGRQFTVAAELDKVLGAMVRVLERRAAGGFWIGTQGGALAWFSEGRISLLSPMGNPITGDIRDILEENGTLWVGTTHGLFRWKHGRFSRLSRTQGLFDDVILHVQPDGKGNLWMTCNKGIFRVSQEELEAVADGKLARVTAHVYGKEDGMRAQECNSLGGPAGVHARDGRLWFPTIRGAVAYDARHERPPTAAPPILIEEVWVDGQPFSASEWSRLPPGEGRVDIRYTSTNLSSPERLRFRYRLEGVDADWVDAGSRRVAYYTRLPPGDHRFLVEAFSAGGNGPTSSTQLAFHLQPRYYQTALFRLVCGLAAVLAGAGGVWLRLHRSRERERRLQLRVDERTAELAMRLEQLEATRERLAHAEKMAAMGTLAAGVGHEINNPLAYILSNLRFITTELRGFTKSEEELELWQEVEEALADALQGAERVRKIVHALRTLARAQVEPPKRVELQAVLDHALEVMDKELRPRARVAKEYGPPQGVLGDETRLSQVFLHLLTNSIHAIPEGQPELHEIRVLTRQEADGRAIIEVRDSGHGIAPEHLPRIFEPFFTTKEAGEGTGLGLSICHSTIQAMGGEIQVESELGRGTTFRILLPPLSAEVEEGWKFTGSAI